jgi:hypothetical protein
MLERNLMPVVTQNSGNSKDNYKVSVAVSFFFKFFNVVLSETLFKKVITICAIFSFKMAWSE